MRLTHAGPFALGALLSLAGTARAAPCLNPLNCSEWIGPGSSQVLVYRNYPLTSTNPAITRAVVVVHGASRDADNQFRSMLAGAFVAGALDNTLVVSIRFASNNGEGCADKVADREATWQCSGPERWTAGGRAVDNPGVTTFDLMDELLLKLSHRDTFPNLRMIVLAGHSAGGMFVNRYEMANLAHAKVTVPVRYVVANPSSYGYLDASRPSVTVFAANVSALGPGYVAALPEKPPAPFGPFGDARNCTGYDQWPYGLKDRVGYAAKLTDDQLKAQAVARSTVYLLGGLDILPLFGFDASCAAMAQGPTRLARGLAWIRYVTDTLGAKHEVRLVPNCGHNSRCMFTDDGVVELLFRSE